MIFDRGNKHNSHVYFVSDSNMRAIKIGISTDPIKRLSGLQTGSPDELVLICAIPGDLDLEQSIHRMFSHLNIGGEWFRPDDELIEFIRKCQAGEVSHRDRHTEEYVPGPEKVINPHTGDYTEDYRRFQPFARDRIIVEYRDGRRWDIPKGKEVFIFPEDDVLEVTWFECV